MGLRTFDPPLGPPSTLGDFFRHMCYAGYTGYAGYAGYAGYTGYTGYATLHGY